MITVTFDFPPSTNNLWRAGKSATGKHQTYLSKQYASWKTAAEWTAKAAAKANGRIEGKYFIEIAAKRPDRRKRDLDNLIKPISDALVKGGIIEDDSKCEFIHARWDDAIPSGVRVSVEAYPETHSKQGDDLGEWITLADAVGLALKNIGKGE